jgi:hypothetical protein
MSDTFSLMALGTLVMAIEEILVCASLLECVRAMTSDTK